MLYKMGSVVLYDVPGQKPTIYSIPDLRMFESCDECWKKIIEKYESFEGGNPKAVKTGHKNFLEDAVLMFYQAGPAHEKKAMKLYRRLQREHLYDPVGWKRTEYTVPFKTFVRNRLEQEMKGIGIKDAIGFIVSVLREGYFYYAIHEDDLAAGRESMAQEIHDIHQKSMGIDEPGRLGLPSMNWFRYQAFLAFLNDPMYPDYMKESLLGRLQIERPDLFEELKKQEIEFFERMKKLQQQQES
jgi:hypothetical protein